MQVHTAFLAQFHQRQSEIRIVMQIVHAHFIENGRTPIVVAFFKELPNLICHSMRRTYGVAQRHPRAALNGIHQETFAPVIEQDGLVARIGQEWTCGILCSNNRASSLQICVGWFFSFVGSKAQ
jgi:hypothetical protein